LPCGFEAQGETWGDGLEDGGDEDALEGLGGEVWVHGFKVEGCGCELDVMFELEYASGLTMRCLSELALQSPKLFGVELPES